MRSVRWLILALILLSLPSVTAAQHEAPTDEPETQSAVEETSEPERGVLRFGPVVIRPELKLYADYVVDVADEDLSNAFHIGRAYLGLRAQLTDWLGLRITYDVSQAKDLGSAGSASEGDDGITVGESRMQGSELGRLKYGYIDLSVSAWSLKIRFGIVQTPWIGWIEHIEDSRFLRKVMIEEAFHYPSADFGLTVIGEIGEHLAYHLGIYNGEGYHGLEVSEAKDVIGRVSVRPLPNVNGLEGLVLSGYAQVEVFAPDPEEGSTSRRFGGALTYRLADEIASNDSGHAEGELLAAWFQAFYGQDGPSDDFVNSFGFSAGGRVELPANLFLLGRLGLHAELHL